MKERQQMMLFFGTPEQSSEELEGSSEAWMRMSFIPELAMVMRDVNVDVDAGVDVDVDAPSGSFTSRRMNWRSLQWRRRFVTAVGLW